MDFRPSDRVTSLLERVRAFSEEHVLPVEDETLAALDDEVQPGVAYPAALVDIRERAKAEGLWNLFQDFVAKSRMEIDSARWMVLHAAWMMDTPGKREARQDISMIKVIAARIHQDVLDRAMQVHGALGMSDDVPLALAWRQGRWLRIADGPDEVHKASIARRELNRFKSEETPAQSNGAPQGATA